MRARLLDATIECLSEYGYGRMSTNDVVRRAHVSRGALAHHFPAKADLVKAAAQRLLEQRAADFRARFAAIPAQRRTLSEALTVLWSLYDDPTLSKQFPYLTPLKASILGAQPRPKVVKYGDVTAAIQNAAYGALSGAETPDKALADLQTKLQSLITN